MKFSSIALICAIATATSVTAQGDKKPCKGRTEQECTEPECQPIKNKILGRTDGKPFHESNAPIIWGFNYCKDPNAQDDGLGWVLRSDTGNVAQ